MEEYIEEVQQGDLDVKLHIRSEKDVLGIGFEHMIEAPAQDLRWTAHFFDRSGHRAGEFLLHPPAACRSVTVKAIKEHTDDLLNKLRKSH